MAQKLVSVCWYYNLYTFKCFIMQLIYMVEFKKRQTELEIDGISVSRFVDKKFLSSLNTKLKTQAAALVILAEEELDEKDKDGKPKIKRYPIIFEHGTDEDYKNKIMKIRCRNADVFEKVMKVLEEME